MSERLAEFMAREPEPFQQLISRGILPVKGKMIIAGPPKANKSFVALNIALDMALGQCLFGAKYKNGTPVFPVTKPCRVLYIEQELGENGLKDRMRALLLANGLDPSLLEFYVKTKDMSMRCDTPEGRAAISAEIAAVKPDCTFLDPMAKFHLSDENSAQHMGAVMRIGDRWIEEHHTALVWIHHIGKENAEHPKRGGDRLRGSSAIFADTDTLMEVKRKSAASNKEPILELDFELRRGEPLEAVYLKRLRSGQIIYCGEEFQIGRGSEVRTAKRDDAPTTPYADL